MNDEDMHSDGAGRQLPEIRTIDFHGDQIVTFEAGGKPYVAMRRIVENMRIAWEGQRPKLQEQHAKFNCHDIMTVGADGKQREMLCMPVDKLPLWLATINPNKVKDPAIRAKVEEYQAESAIALHDYWTKGAAIKGDYDGIVTGLDPAVMNAIGGMMKKIMRKQLQETVPQLVEHAMLEGGHVVSTEFKPALEVLKDCKVPSRKRRSFSQKVSGRLRRFSTMWQFPLRLSRETNRYLFHIEAIKKWMSAEGDQMIRDHVAVVSGQGVLHLVPPSKPDGSSPKPSRRKIIAGLAMAGILSLAGHSPEAKALPAPSRDGLAVLQIEGKRVVVDTNRFKVGPDDLVVRIHHDGHISVGPVMRDASANWHGARGAAEEWRLQVHGEPGHFVRGRVYDYVQVLGVVIDQSSEAA